MRVSKDKINLHLEKELFKVLHQVIADLKNPEDIREFFDAFLSNSEHAAIAKRVGIAYWLDKGRSYANIQNNLKVSSATIAVVHSSLEKKGIQLTLEQIKAEEWANIWTEKIQKFIKRTS